MENENKLRSAAIEMEVMLERILLEVCREAQSDAAGRSDGVA